METLIVYPENKEQLSALKAVIEAMKIAFVPQTEPEVYPQHVVDGVNAALKESELREGLVPYTNARDMIKKK